MKEPAFIPNEWITVEKDYGGNMITSVDALREGGDTSPLFVAEPVNRLFITVQVSKSADIGIKSILPVLQNANMIWIKVMNSTMTDWADISVSILRSRSVDNLCFCKFIFCGNAFKTSIPFRSQISRSKETVVVSSISSG